EYTGWCGGRQTVSAACGVARVRNAASGGRWSILLAPHLRDDEVGRPRLRLRRHRLPGEAVEPRPQFLHLLRVLVSEVRLLERVGLQVEQLRPGLAGLLLRHRAAVRVVGTAGVDHQLPVAGPDRT